jgi:hypothetical protein
LIFNEIKPALWKAFETLGIIHPVLAQMARNVWCFFNMYPNRGCGNEKRYDTSTPKLTSSESLMTKVLD